MLTDPTRSTCPVFRAGAPDCFVQVHQSLVCLLTSLCINHQEIINRRLEQICRLHLTQDWSGLGDCYSSRTQINAGGQNRATIRASPRPLLKSGLQSYGRCGTHQETISRRPEQVYLPSDPRLEWPGEGPLFEFNLNKCWGQSEGTIRVTPGPLFMSGLWPLAR